MKICPNCKSEVDESFDMCWNCQYSFDENRIIDKTEFKDLCPNCNTEVNADMEFCPNCSQKIGIYSKGLDGELPDSARKIDCLRCKLPMLYKGNTEFGDSGFFELFPNKETFELFYCPQCGKVELFLPMEEE